MLALISRRSSKETQEQAFGTVSKFCCQNWSCEGIINVIVSCLIHTQGKSSRTWEIKYHKYLLNLSKYHKLLGLLSWVHSFQEVSAHEGSRAAGGVWGCDTCDRFVTRTSGWTNSSGSDPSPLSRTEQELWEITMHSHSFRMISLPTQSLLHWNGSWYQ